MVAYAISFSAVASTAVAKEIFDILPSTSARLRVIGLYIAKTTMGATECMTVDVYRGSSIASAGGSTLTVTALDARFSSSAGGTGFGFTGLMNSSSPGSSGTSAKRLFAGRVNDNEPFVWEPIVHGDGQYDYRPVIGIVGSSAGIAERLQVRMSASQAAASISGTLIVEEIGKGL